MNHATLDLILTPEPYISWGPLSNHWGYVMEIAHFQDGVIMIKYTTPSGDAGLAYCKDWEDCERFIILLDQDRRF